MKTLLLIVFLSLSSLCVQGINALRDSSSSFLQTENGLLPSFKLYEQNEKIINDIYFSTLARGIDTFTVSQTADIYEIANQCPISGGKGVYYARSLLRLIDDSTDFDDKFLCFAEGIEYRQAQTQNLIKESEWDIFPNPANNAISLQNTNPILGEIHLIWVNLLGITVAQQSISMKGNEQIISTAFLPDGIYYLQIKQDGNNTISKKVVITH